MLGKKHSEESKKLIGAKNTGRKRPDLAIRNKSLENRRRVGITKTGTKRAPFSGEWRRNMSEALKKSGHRPPVCWGANNNKWKGGITPHTGKNTPPF